MDHSAEPLYIFLHIPKSAGTTFRHHLEHNFPADEILGLYNGDGRRLRREDVFAELAALPAARRVKLRVVYGHEVHYGIHELFDRPCRYFTFLRDPIEKTISFYNYRMQQGVRGGKLDAARLPPFDEWLRSSTGMHDGMLGDLRKYGFADGEDVSDEALRRIFEKFYFVGTTENFDEDAMFLYHDLGVRRFFRDQNKSQRFLAESEVEAARRLIAEKTTLDRRLYDAAVACNREFKARHTEFARIVTSMKLKRKLGTVVQRLLPT